MRAAYIGLACVGTLGLAALVGLHASPSAADYEARFQIVPQDNGGSVWLLNTMTGELGCVWPRCRAPRFAAGRLRCRAPARRAGRGSRLVNDRVGFLWHPWRLCGADRSAGEGTLAPEAH
jgi:hypothetical protein